MELQKARLQAINADGSTRGDPIPVQFNPSSLRLQISNQVEGGATRGRQVRQYTGSSSTTLSLELIFDTADEGQTDAPVSVRTKTMAVEQFLYPQEEGTQKQAPPKLRFEWGDLVLEGVVESLNIDLDHFAPNGVPLRAKVGFSFKEQDRRYELLAAGAGANQTGNAPNPGQATGGGPGSTGPQTPSQVEAAIGGESAADFATRLGLDASAWRGLSFGASLGGSLSLDAGLEVGFSAGLSASAGVGVFAGASAGASVSLEASVGLEAAIGVSAVANVGADINLQQGFSLTASGGVGAAIETVKITKAGAAAAQTKAAFSVSSAAGGSGAAGTSAATNGPSRGASSSISSAATPANIASAVAAAPPARPSLPEQTRTPLRLTNGVPLSSTDASAPPAPAPPVADPRAVSYGFGVPLRSTIRAAGSLNTASLQGSAAVVARGGGTDVPTTFDPTVPPWRALPARASSIGANRPGKRGGHCSCGRCGGKAL